MNTQAEHGLQVDQRLNAAEDDIDALQVAQAGYTASDVLTKINTVEGSGSGWDADTLDGQHAASFTPYGFVMPNPNVGRSNLGNPTILEMARGFMPLRRRGVGRGQRTLQFTAGD